MRNIPVICADDEYARFPPPAGQTCEAYMAPYVAQAPGYLLDPSSTTECAYCQVRLGNTVLTLPVPLADLAASSSTRAETTTCATSTSTTASSAAATLCVLPNPRASAQPIDR